MEVTHQDLLVVERKLAERLLLESHLGAIKVLGPGTISNGERMGRRLCARAGGGGDGFPLNDMPADAERLLQLLHSLLMVSYAVEVWTQPEVIHCGSARIDRVLEPRP